MPRIRDLPMLNIFANRTSIWVIRSSNRVHGGATASVAVPLTPAARFRPRNGAICALVYTAVALTLDCPESPDGADAPARFCSVQLNCRPHGNGYAPFSLICVCAAHGELRWQNALLRGVPAA